MVERIELLNSLSRVELIKLLNVGDMDLEKLIDLYIKIKNELKVKYDKIDRIEFKDEYNGFYNMKLSDKYNNGKLVGLMDLLKLIDLDNMDYCELLYLNVLVEDVLENKYLKNHRYDFLNNSDMLYLKDNGICGFGKINFVNYNGLLYGVDKNYNFYLGKIDSDNNCILFNVLRKGIPDDLSNDVFLFNGKVFSDNSIDGVWSIGTRDTTKGIRDITNMDNNISVDNKNYHFNVKDLYLAYISCSNYTNTLDNLMNNIYNKGVRKGVGK